MDKPIINLAELEFRESKHGEKYEARVGAIGPKLGAQKLGYNLTVLAPGKVGWPRHAHRVNEEMFFVVEGEGEVRIGDARHPIRQGDVIACPPGGPETAHQIKNTSDKDLKILSVSTKLSPDVAEYPDSGKFGVLTDFGLRFVSRAKDSLDYWDGED